MSSRSPLQNRMGYSFKKPELLELALTHPSVNHEQKKTLTNNQRLEFLGDAVLQMIISAELYRQFPAHDEGTLSKARARMVNREALAEQAAQIKLGGDLMLSRGEERNGGRERTSALADAFESVVGAIYLDGGFMKVKKFILIQFSERFEGANAGRHVDNPKGELQEILQGKSAVAPEYRLLDSQGPDHDRSFECAVRHSGRELARGTGKSKKTAETDAATKAIQLLRTQGQA
tara:strand:+ start:1080 stop:1778 length:699 start_codon:yes stop_codon:yes gene_type:complete